MTQNGTITPEHWMAGIFAAKAARDESVIRRSVRDIERYVGRTTFLRKLERRGFQAVENAGQLVIFCNRKPIRRIL